MKKKKDVVESLEWTPLNSQKDEIHSESHSEFRMKKVKILHENATS